MNRKSELTFKYPNTLIKAHPACQPGVGAGNSET